MYEQFMRNNPDVKVPDEERLEHVGGIRIAEIHFEFFEKSVDIEALYATQTKEETENNANREVAKELIKPMLKMIQRLKAESDIPEDVYDELFERYIYYSRAIGVINNGMVDHER